MKRVSARKPLPDPNADNALAVCDGQSRIGSVVKQNDEYFAFDERGKFIAIADSMVEAARKISAVRP